MKLTANRVPGQKRITVVCHHDDGRESEPLTVQGLSISACKKATEVLGCPLDAFKRLVSTFPPAAATYELEVNTAKAPEPTIAVLTRPIASLDGTVANVGPNNLDIALRVPNDQVLCWESLDDLACLDIDYHSSTPPPPLALRALMDELRPSPFLWHFSKGGGIHAFYKRSEKFTARELACVAALRMRQVDPNAGVEIKNKVRAAGELQIHPGLGDTEVTLTGWIGEAEQDEDLIKEYLDSQGLEVGQRYSHTRCPIDPNDTAQGTPVVVYCEGIHCHRCHAKGVTFGGKVGRAGWASYGQLLRTSTGGEFGIMVKNRVHWGHAKWVLKYKYDLDTDISRVAYGAAIKAAHGIDGVSGLFLDDIEDIARVGDSWVNIESSYTYPDKDCLKTLIAAFPHCKYLDQNGDLKVSQTKVAYLRQGHNLADRGYRGLRIVHGYRLAARHLPHSLDTFVPVVAEELRGQKYAPRYSRAMSVSEAERVIEEVFPGVDWSVVRTLICAAGCAQETMLGEHPMMFLSGCSASGKTTHCKIASGIIGSAVSEVTYNPDDAQLKRSVKRGAETAALVVANEFVKDSCRMLRRRDPRAAFEPLLTLTPTTAVHVLFVGPRNLGRLPPLIITEPEFPAEIADYTQVARRLRYKRISNSKKSWSEIWGRLGLESDKIHLFRKLSDRVATAADVILSDVIDNCFGTPMTWNDLADMHGAKKVTEHDDMRSPDPSLRRLFAYCCTLTEETEPKFVSLHGSGFRQIHKTDTRDGRHEDALYIYSSFSNGGTNWGKADALIEKDWNAILNYTGDEIQLDIVSDGVSAVYLRWRTGTSTTPKLCNSEILDGSTWL